MIGRKTGTKINMLMDIMSYFGTTKGRMAPTIIFLSICAAPLFVYIFLLVGIIPFVYVAILEVVVVITAALKIFGKSDKKFAIYMAARNDQYGSANDVIKIADVSPDGMVEFFNGTVMYIISAYTTTYYSEDDLVDDEEKFVKQLKPFVYDIHGHNVVDEVRMQDDLEKLTVYTDEELARERMEHFVYQDEECSKNSTLYRLNFAVKASRYDWKDLKAVVENAVKSVYARVFRWVYVCDGEQARDVISRDLNAYVDLEEMITKKYMNAEIYESRVMYYGDDVPEELTVQKESVDLESRRVVEE